MFDAVDILVRATHTDLILLALTDIGRRVLTKTTCLTSDGTIFRFSVIDVCAVEALLVFLEGSLTLFIMG